jgi:hypothetical protein
MAYRVLRPSSHPPYLEYERVAMWDSDMADGSHVAQASPRGWPRSPSWAGYATCAWALLFAASNVSWGLGGRLACPLPNCEAAFSDPSFVTLN